MRELDAPEALVAHDRGNACARPETKIRLMLGEAARQLGNESARLGNTNPKPWFCAVISTRPVRRFITGWLPPR